MKRHLALWMTGLAVVLLFGHVNVSRAQLMEVPLVAGQNTVVGTVTAAVLETTLIAIIATDEDWEMDLVHLAVAPSLDGIPRNLGGNPQIGRFPHQFVGGPGVQSLFIELELDFVPDPQQQLVLAIHSEVVRASERGNVYCDRCAGQDNHCRSRDDDDDDDDGGRRGSKGDDVDHRDKGDEDRKHSGGSSKGNKSNRSKDDDCDRHDSKGDDRRHYSGSSQGSKGYGDKDDDHKHNSSKGAGGKDDDDRKHSGGSSKGSKSKGGKDDDCDRRNKGDNDRNCRDDDDDDDDCDRRGDSNDDDDDCVCRKAGETAWAYGLPFGGGSWAMYMSFYPFDGSDN